MATAWRLVDADRVADRYWPQLLELLDVDPELPHAGRDVDQAGVLFRLALQRAQTFEQLAAGEGEQLPAAGAARKWGL